MPAAIPSLRQNRVGRWAPASASASPTPAEVEVGGDGSGAGAIQVGDVVQIGVELDEIKLLQRNHGEWADSMLPVKAAGDRPPRTRPIVVRIDTGKSRKSSSNLRRRRSQGEKIVLSVFPRLILCSSCAQVEVLGQAWTYNPLAVTKLAAVSSNAAASTGGTNANRNEFTHVLTSCFT